MPLWSHAYGSSGVGCCVDICSLDSCSGSMRDSKCNSPSSPAGPGSPAESVTGGLTLTDSVGRAAADNVSSSFTHVLQSLSRPASRGQLPFTALWFVNTAVLVQE